MQHWNTKYNDKLSYDDRAGYRQAHAEGDALSGRLGVPAQILALAEVYRELRLAGKTDEAMALKARVNAIVTGGK
jgi:hypothetical protein